MTTTTKKLGRKVYEEPPVPIEDRIAAFIADHELEWWLNKTYRTAARAETNRTLKIKISTKDWSNIVYHYCKIYTKWKRKNSSAKTLTEDQWDKLKIAVDKLAPMLKDREFGHALSIVQSKIACNATILKGLPTRFHFWL